MFYMLLPVVKLHQNNPGLRESEIHIYSYYWSGTPKQRYTTLKKPPHVPAICESYTFGK